MIRFTTMLALLALTACGGVTEEEYSKVVQERDAAVANVKKADEELVATQAKLVRSEKERDEYRSGYETALREMRYYSESSHAAISAIEALVPRATIGNRLVVCSIANEGGWDLLVGKDGVSCQDTLKTAGVKYYQDAEAIAFKAVVDAGEYLLERDDAYIDPAPASEAVNASN